MIAVLGNHAATTSIRQSLRAGRKRVAEKMRVSGAGNRGFQGHRRERVSVRPDAIASCTDQVGSRPSWAEYVVIRKVARRRVKSENRSSGGVFFRIGKEWWWCQDASPKRETLARQGQLSVKAQWLSAHNCSTTVAEVPTSCASRPVLRDEV
jgi:hypothetical protein